MTTRPLDLDVAELASLNVVAVLQRPLRPPAVADALGRSGIRGARTRAAVDTLRL